MKTKYLIALFVLLAACTRGKEENRDGSRMEMHQQQMSETYVDTMVLHQAEFNKQIVCNGRLRAKANNKSCSKQKEDTSISEVSSFRFVCICLEAICRKSSVLQGCRWLP